MKYEGRIFGKVAGRYIELHTTADLDASIVNAEKAKKYDELKEKIIDCYLRGRGLRTLSNIVTEEFIYEIDKDAKEF